MTGAIELHGNGLSAVIEPRGAQLTSLKADWSGELIWQGDAAIWPWHAPNLFPIVGALADDKLIHRGHAYPMKQHGILRLSDCELVEAVPTRCAFRLADSDATRAHYPFAFALAISFALQDGRLVQQFELTNTGTEPLPASLGAHPAFRWPLEPDASRDAYRVSFEQDEPAPIRRLEGRGLGGERPSPVEGRILAPRDELFTEDALIFDKLRSRRVRFGPAQGLSIELDFADFPQFGIWTKPGAGFLCLEPWQGYASPAGFAGEFTEKPGIVTLSPGSTRRWSLSIRPFRANQEDHR
ncbi:MAG TPA: aldose 1-epimerase family protein [Aliidongia sp.]|nr:aldose 1-epimerase family protein [Aliidongia sp.]